MNYIDERKLEDAGFLKKVIAGARDRFGEGRQDYTKALYQSREDEGKSSEGPRINSTVGTNPTFVTAMDSVGKSNPTYKETRDKMSMGLADDRAIRIGQVLGTLGADITQDTSRGLWWLLNAPQAVGSVITESALAQANPKLYRINPTGIKAPEFETNNVNQKVLKKFKDGAKNLQNIRAYEQAKAGGHIAKDGTYTKGRTAKNKMIYQRQYEPGFVDALLGPSSVAINAGIGLLNPFGGSGGYEAVFQSPDDPTKTSNPVLEVAAKYVLGRTGDLLPYSEFSKYRSDVSKAEYNTYKAFKYDKNEDWNPTDGDFTLLNGVLKGTTDGIHGPEIQMLGRSLPLTTTGIPFISALAGGVAGVRTKKPIRGGFIGGSVGLAAGGATGIIAEEIRRRAVSNTTQLEGGNAEQYL